MLEKLRRLRDMDRFKIHEISNEQYYQIPKSLFTEIYKNLSLDAKVIYAFLKDRMYLSQKNKWCDKNGDIFLLFPQQNIAEILGVSVSTVSRAFSALKKHGLIEIIQQGLNKPNKIYIGRVKTCTGDVSGLAPVTCQDLHPCHTNETDSSETDRVRLKESTLSGFPDVAKADVTIDSEELINLPTPAMDSKQIYGNNVDEVVAYLNKQAGMHYRATTPKTRKLIRARIKEGFTVSDFKTVIDKKCGEWLGDDEMVMYLRPETLFGTKFESYLNQRAADPTKIKMSMSKHDKRMFAEEARLEREAKAYDRRNGKGNDQNSTKLLPW